MTTSLGARTETGPFGPTMLSSRSSSRSYLRHDLAIKPALIRTELNGPRAEDSSRHGDVVVLHNDGQGQHLIIDVTVVSPSTDTNSTTAHRPLPFPRRPKN
eukprot:scaffold587966_cov17-Prasinocladus_malaysianus.AAC.1